MPLEQLDTSAGSSTSDSQSSKRYTTDTPRYTTEGHEPDATPQRDWTHKLSMDAAPVRTKYARNEATCPTPTGNWINTCFENIRVEGPCQGRCLLKAKCKNMDKKPQETSFEYREYEDIAIKNVNGLLCKEEDGMASCGMNFHGNLAVKNCADGEIPFRRETHPRGLPVEHEAPEGRSRADNSDPDDRWSQSRRDWDDEGDQRRRPRGYAQDGDEVPTYRRTRRGRVSDDDEEGYQPSQRYSRQGRAMADNRW